MRVPYTFFLSPFIGEVEGRLSLFSLARFVFTKEQIGAKNGP